MQARYYDPVIGRFLSIDPVTFTSSGHPASFNRYAYSLNDPVNLTDPTGTCVDGITCTDPAPITSSTTTISTTTNPSGSETDTRFTAHSSADLSNTRVEQQGSVERLPQQSLGGAPATVTPAMQEKLLNFSEQESQTVQVTSGVRTPAQNAAVNGAKSSPHLSTNPDQAADIKIQGYSRSQTFNAAASSGQFNRTNEYNPSAPNAQSGRAGVHVDLNTTRRQGRYVNWVYQGP